MKKISLFTFMMLAVLFLNSCASKLDYVYLNGNSLPIKTSDYEIKLQADDVLMISVTSVNPEVALPYNLQVLNIQNDSDLGIGQQTRLNYLITKEGTIEFPVLGTIDLKGLTRIEAQQKIRDLLIDHIADANVILKVMNFKITVLGEVNKPGTIQVKSERISVLEAIGSAGDLSIFGKRDNILLIRERDGQTITQRLDLTDINLISSPYYYLAQNDVLYVEPNKTKINSSAVGPNISIGISAISLLITIIALTTR
ncbi:polysaccharide biosynthesis/export family protein [Flavobacterium ardleyense]|uniref:Polysaccharide biosynthesis/export family protein n=1 Tax=Flavobacterium ardleyense TaxID=2038737 RepID=A0ABW5Z316_9FLAO